MTYDPDNNYNGPDSFTFRVTDDGTTNGSSDGLASSQATITITVNAINDNPILTAISSQTTSEDTDITVNLSGSDVDIATNGQSLSFTAESDDETMVVVSTASTGTATGTLSLDVQDNVNGDVTVMVQVSDGNGGLDSTEFTLTITEVNDTPVANAGSFSTNEDIDGSYTLTGDDGDPWESSADDQDLTFAIVNNVAHGTVSLNTSTGALTYDPDNNYNGSDSFTFRVTDDGTTNGFSDGLTSSQATVTITVNAINDEPTILSISLPVDTLIYSNVDGEQLVVVSCSFVDIDSDSLQVNYLDSNNLIHSVFKSIDPETNLVSDTLAYNFTYGNHILTVLIQDDGDNEDGTLLSDSDSVAWALGYAPLEFDSPGYYIITDSIRTLPPITISNGEIENTINTENDLKILLPDDSEFKWAPSQGGISISGNSDLINSQADVSDDQLVLTFDVLTNFSDGESLNITGIRIVDLTQVQGPTKVRMIVDGVSNYSTANSESGNTITVGDTKVELSSTTAFSVGDPDSIIAPGPKSMHCSQV
ncbi:MAG TPA: hypothetical protein EYO20_07580, partial [Gemmatimonadetes bacterium]|nr:hypothetical protein [Gemmatimonadota bacterium]